MQKLLLFSVLSFTLLLLGCQQEKKQHPLIGTWVYEFTDNDIVLEFKTDGTYALDVNSNDGQPGDLIGVYHLKDTSLITLKDSLGGGACLGEGQTGEYTYRVEKERLYMTPVKDECAGRKRLMMTREFGTKLKKP